jgi:hypothetical protein
VDATVHDESWSLLYSLLILHTVGRTAWTRDQPLARPLPTYRTTQTENERTYTSMPQVGFKPTILVFERGKTVHALGRAAAVFGKRQVEVWFYMF